MKTNMKHTLYNTFRLCLFVLATMLPAGVLAQDNTGDVDDAESAAMAKTKQNAITWQETDPTGENYLSARRALVGRHCAVNRVINVVSVNSKGTHLSNVDIISPSGEVEASIQGVEGKGGTFGSAINLIGDGAKSTGKNIAKILSNKFSKIK